MFRIKALINADEIVLFKLRKKKWVITIALMISPPSLYLALIFIIQCFENMFLGGIDFDSYTAYMLGIISFVFFIPLAILLPLSYGSNDLAITDKRLFVKKGLQGRIDIVDFKDIAAYQHITHTNKGITTNFIQIYLKSGKRISSGSLYIKEDNVLELRSILNDKIGYIITSRKQYKALRLNWSTVCCVDERRNYLFPIFSLLPFIIALIMFLLYVGGVNEMGKQMNIQVTGTVIEKSIDYDEREKTSAYGFTILEDKINNEYDVSVTEEIYSMFAESDKIMIKAKKGSLGIVYNKWFYTQ